MKMEGNEVFKIADRVTVLRDGRSIGTQPAAGVDRRIGAKFTGEFDKFDQWRAPKAAFDYWAMRMKIRMIEFQGRPAAE